MNQSPYTRINRSIRNEVRKWRGSQTLQMVATVPGSLCRALVEELKQFKKNSPWLNPQIGGTATTEKLSETPLRLSPSKCEELETQREEGLQWALIPIRQTDPAHFDPDERPPMPFPKDFEWPTPPYIKCSDLAKCGYPHIYTVLERGLAAIGWSYNINVGRWYPPSTVPGDQEDGKDNLERAKGTAFEGLRPAGERERARRQRTGGLSNRYS